MSEQTSPAMTDAREKAREALIRKTMTELSPLIEQAARAALCSNEQQARAEALEEAMRIMCHGCAEGLRFAPIPHDPALSVHWSDGESWGCCDAGPIRARHPAGWHVQTKKEPT